MQVINIKEIENIKLGNYSDFTNATGCTVIYSERFMPTGICVKGGGPASRESNLCNSLTFTEGVNAIVLSGGSAYGLDSASGVMKYLEENNIGLPVINGVVVPLVVGSSLFDLGLGSSKVRPDASFGYQACLNSENKFESGNFGAGLGCSIGKINGMSTAMKSGLGQYAVEANGVKVGAVVAVNAIGDVFENGEKLAGLLNNSKSSFLSSSNVLIEKINSNFNAFNTNTTIASVFTNAKFDKRQMNKMASNLTSAFSNTIKPVFTSFDGDTIYASSCGDVDADFDAVSVLANYVLEKAIVDAIKSTDSAYGLMSYQEFRNRN